MSYLEEDISSDPSDYSDIDYSSQSSNESVASSPSVLDPKREIHSVFNDDQIQQSIINNPFIQQLIHNTKMSACHETNNNALNNGSHQETPNYAHHTPKTSQTIKMEPMDDINMKQHQPPSTVISRIKPQTVSRFDRTDLERQCLDELLAKAMFYVPSLRWDEDNEWCRYCGARVSTSFLRSPWGIKQLCSTHHHLWKQNKLDLSMFPSAPIDIDSVINKRECTEKEYLIDLLTNIDMDNDGKRRSLRNQIKIKEEKPYFYSSNEEESSSESFHSSYSISSEDQDVDDDDYSYIGMNEYNMIGSESENGVKMEYNSVPIKRERDWKKYYKNMNCTICNYRFVTHTSYRNHMNGVHGITRAYKCYRCPSDVDVRYSNNAGLNAHIRRDHDKIRRFKCTLCPKAFYERSVLDKHQRVHDGLKPFECIYCKAKFTQKASLRQHVRSIHLKQRNYKCSYCTKGFAALGTMKSHMVRIHDDTKYARFQCDVCYKRFYEKGHFMKHKDTSRCRRHPMEEAIKRGECFHKGCNKKYRSKTRAESVKVHLVRVHKDRRYARYECRECDKLFYDKTSYSKHNRKRHNNFNKK